MFFSDLEVFKLTTTSQELSIIDIISTIIMFSLIAFYITTNLIKKVK